jgi:predicted transcriptional regulator
MSKAVLISIKPEWTEKIVQGKKTIEVRRTAPKEVPFKAYIYCTSQKFDGEILLTADKKVERRYKHCRDNGDIPLAGKVIGEFICDKVYLIKNQGNRFVVANEEQGVTNEIARQSCLDYDDMDIYLGDKDGYGWHISDLKIYDKPKELSEFTSPRVCGNYKDLPAYIHVGCNICEYSYTINCMIKCRIDGRKPLTRPPQSYMYVEEVEQ